MPEESTIQSVALLEEKAASASVDVEAKRKVLEAAIEHRDALVLELYDSGAGLIHVSRTMHLSKSRVIQIIASRG